MESGRDHIFQIRRQGPDSLLVRGRPVNHWSAVPSSRIHQKHIVLFAVRDFKEYKNTPTCRITKEAHGIFGVRKRTRITVTSLLVNLGESAMVSECGYKDSAIVASTHL
jgi:hypothetical protein